MTKKEGGGGGGGGDKHQATFCSISINIFVYPSCVLGSKQPNVSPEQIDQ